MTKQNALVVDRVPISGRVQLRSQWTASALNKTLFHPNSGVVE